jgi:hypothetical protein
MRVGFGCGPPSWASTMLAGLAPPRCLVDVGVRVAAGDPVRPQHDLVMQARAHGQPDAVDAAVRWPAHRRRPAGQPGQQLVGAFQAGPVECLTVLGQIAMRPGTIRHFVYMPFPAAFKETFAPHIAALQEKGAVFVFESSWKKPYSTRGVRTMLVRYAGNAGLDQNMPPHRLRHFLFTWLKTYGIDDAVIQPYSGHASRTSLEIYSKIALGSAQDAYKSVIDQFPV